MAAICLKLSDLDPEFQEKSYEEQVMIANIGAVCYRGLGDVMREALQKELSFKDKVKMETLRTSLEKEVLLPLQKANSEIAEGYMRCNNLEKQVELLKKQVNLTQEEIEKEIQRRVQYDFAVRMSDLNTELASLKVKEQYHRKMEEYVKRLEEEKGNMNKHIQKLEGENHQLNEEIKKTLQKEPKSLRDIGKEGEALIHELLKKKVSYEFKKVTVEDVSHIGHSGDFHLFLTTPEKKRIKILIDSKKYKTPVSNVEIAKLMRDVDSDDEATAGLLISIDSGISAKEQCQVEKTPKCKPIMYLSFEDVDDEMRGGVLCMAIRMIITLVSGYSEIEKDIMIDNIELFIKDVEDSIKDLNSLAVQCKKMNESILKLRMKLIEKINKFQSLTESAVVEEVVGEVIEHIDVGENNSRCKGSTRNGAQCKFSCTPNGEYCLKHTK